MQKFSNESGDDNKREDFKEQEDQDLLKQDPEFSQQICPAQTAAADAFGTKHLETMEQFVENQRVKIDPKEQFQKLQMDYFYESRGNPQKQSVFVKNLTGETNNQYIIDMQMQVFSAESGCVAVVKTVEFNSMNTNQYIKILRFYDFQQGIMKKEFVVDSGLITKPLRYLDISIAHFQDHIFFYKRFENELKLQQLNLKTLAMQEVKGFTIQEPDPTHYDQPSYHVMFSQEYESQEQQYANVEDFLDNLLVCVQEYSIGNNSEYNLRDFYLFGKVKEHLKSSFKLLFTLNERNNLTSPVQHACHFIDQGENLIHLQVFDSFCAYNIQINAQSKIVVNQNGASCTKYLGNNEFQMKEDVLRQLMSRNKLYELNGFDSFYPFLKHSSPSFWIQSSNVVYTYHNKKRQVKQYFFLTNENQYMLIYPNYSDVSQKNEVLSNIAKEQTYCQYVDKEFNIVDDLEQRLEDYNSGRYRKVCHVNSNPYKSRNQMKQTEHIVSVLNDVFKSNHINFRILCSADNLKTQIFVYQDRVSQGAKFEIQTFTVNECLQKPKAITTLASQIEDIQLKLNLQYGFPKNERKIAANNFTYYLNSKYTNVVSHTHFIRTNHQQRIFDGEQNKFMSHFIQKEYSDNFVFVEHKGLYLPIKIKRENSDQSIKLQFYTKSKDNFLFIFTLTDEREKLDRKHTWFAVKKSVSDVKTLGEQNSIALIQKDLEITVFNENAFNGDTEEDVLLSFTTDMTFDDLTNFKQKGQDFLINLTFEKLIDSATQLNFVPIVYQLKSQLQTHRLLMFDIHQMKVVKQIDLISSLGLRKNLRQTLTGFGEYQLTRTGDVHNAEEGHLTMHSCDGLNKSTQDTKFQVTAQFYLSDVQGREDVYDDYDPSFNLNPAKCVVEFKEYHLHYNCCGKNTINQISLKYLLVSPDAQVSQEETFKNLLILPYIHKSGKVRGSQLVLKSVNDQKIPNPSECILMLDQDYNNLYQYSTKMVQFGVQKIMVNPLNQLQFMFVVSCQLRQKVYKENYFDEAESCWVLHKIIKKLMSQNQAKYENYLMNDDFNLLQKDEFFKSQELLYGKSLMDISLIKPNEVAQGLLQDEQAINNLKGSIIDELSCSKKSLIEIYENMDLCEKCLLIQMDFNFVSTLRYAYELNENQAVKIILDKIFDINSIDYQDFFMMELPVQLKQPRIEKIYDFLHRDYEEAKQIEKENQMALAQGEKQMKSKYLNFEDFLNHPFLPPFLSQKVSYLAKQDFKDHWNYEQEIIMEVVEAYPYMTWNVQNYQDGTAKKKKNQTISPILVKEEKNVEVEHSAIDFQRMIIGEKIRAIQEQDYQKFEFNDQTLAEIFLIKDDEHLEFYNCDAVRKVVDFQFLRCKKFMMICFGIYLCGFMVPFLITLSYQNVEKKDSTIMLNILFGLMEITQVFFMSFEFAQLKEQKLAYFKNIWNLLDSSQFAFFTLLYVIKITSQFQSDSLPEQFLQSLILIQSFNKILYYLRIWDGPNFLISIMAGLLLEVLPFVLMVFVIIVLLSKLYIIQHFALTPEEDFKGYDSNSLVAMMIMIYKSNKGSVNVPTLDPDFKERSERYPSLQAFFYFTNLVIWFLQQCIFIFFGGTFGMRILQSYDCLNASMKARMYRTKATLNSENFDILDNFTKSRSFKVICFSFDKKLKWDTFAESNGFVHKVQNEMMVMNFENKLKKEQQDQVLEERHAKLEETKQLAGDLYYKLQELTKKIR